MNRRLAYFFSGIVVLAFITTTVSIAVRKEDQPISAEIQQTMLARAATKTGFVFPKGTTLYGVKQESAQDEAVFIKIGTDQSGFRNFLSANALDNVKFDESLRGLFGPDDGWWDPKQPATLPTAMIERADARGRRVGYTVLPNSNVNIYIMWFTLNQAAG